jgi:hypothetical protein
MGLANMYMQISHLTKASGKMMCRKVRDYSYGKMDPSMMVTLKKDSKMAMVISIGLMVLVIKGNGKWELSMV